MVIDPKLKFHKHVEHISNKISKSIGIFYKIKNLLTRELKILLYYSLIYPYLLYSISIWGGTYISHLKPLYLLQKRIVRIITDEHYLAHTPPLFYSTRILRFSDIHKFIILQIGFKAGFNSENSVHSYFTRNNRNVRTPFQRLSLCQNSFYYKLPIFWNSLPNNIKSIESYSRFKKELKSYLLAKYLTL